MRRTRSLLAVGSVVASLVTTLMSTTSASALRVSYEYKNSGSYNACLGVGNGQQWGGTIVWSCNGNSDQAWERWQVLVDYNDPYGPLYTFRNLYGYCLESSAFLGYPATSSTCDSTSQRQRWYIHKNGDGTENYISSVEKWCLGTWQGGMNPGTSTAMWYCNGNPDQKWYLGQAIYSN